MRWILLVALQFKVLPPKVRSWWNSLYGKNISVFLYIEVMFSWLMYNKLTFRFGTMIINCDELEILITKKATAFQTVKRWHVALKRKRTFNDSEFRSLYSKSFPKHTPFCPELIWNVNYSVTIVTIMKASGNRSFVGSISLFCAVYLSAVTTF